MTVDRPLVPPKRKTNPKPTPQNDQTNERTNEQERSVVEKNSEYAKMRTTARSRNRKSRENAKAAFLDEDGDYDG